MTNIVAGAVVLYFDTPLPPGDSQLALDFIPVRSPNGTEVLGALRVANVDISDDRCRMTVTLDTGDTPSLEDMAEAARNA